MSKIKLVVVSVIAVLGISFLTPLAVPTGVNAGTARDSVRSGVNEVGGTENTQSLPALIRTVINVLLFLIGAVAVIMIIIGGLKYVLSGGDQSAVTSAKNTILYAVIGLVVAILAYAIVNFVISGLAPPPPES